ncbi:MAG TPA: head-tail adaptor protein [Firmicutes bacterium]|nr:head-tail adaptor protein [Bacillota bacterium]
MIIGRMDKRITLQKPSKTPDGQGGRKKDFEDVATVWAEFRRPKMATEVEAGAVISDMTQEISIRYRTDVKRGWRVLYGDRSFDVIHPPYDYNRENTILVCREVVR